MTSTPGTTALDRCIGGMGTRRRVERDDHVFGSESCVDVVKGNGCPSGYVWRSARRLRDSACELTIHGDGIGGRP